MSRKPIVLAALAAVVLIAAASFLAMRFFMAAPDGLDLARDKATTNGLYRVSVRPEADPVPQGQMHAWMATITTADGQPVGDARVTIGGGMPQHGHGLPTQPQASAAGEGRYRIEGVRFNMGGWWVLKLVVDGPAGSDEAEFNIVL